MQWSTPLLMRKRCYGWEQDLPCISQLVGVTCGSLSSPWFLLGEIYAFPSDIEKWQGEEKGGRLKENWNSYPVLEKSFPSWCCSFWYSLTYLVFTQLLVFPPLESSCYTTLLLEKTHFSAFFSNWQKYEEDFAFTTKWKLYSKFIFNSKI